MVGGVGGVRGRHYILMLPALLAVYHKSQNKGLTSVNRRTSLLSHLQYPVLSKSSTEDLSFSVPEMRLSMVLD